MQTQTESSSRHDYKSHEEEGQKGNEILILDWLVSILPRNLHGTCTFPAQSPEDVQGGFANGAAARLAAVRQEVVKTRTQVST